MTAANRPPLLLASSSPRRRDLLAQLAIVADAVFSPNIDETPGRAELPHLYAMRMAREKAQAAIGHMPGAVILSCDTTVAAGRRIIGPPTQNDEEIRACLSLLSGRRHRVHSAVCAIDPEGRLRARLSTTIVQFKRLSTAEIDAYVAHGEGMGKAGGYAIQGRAGGFVKQLSGSYSGVVGLPLYETRALLVASGYILP